MKLQLHRLFVASLITGSLVFATHSPALGLPAGKPVDLPCATDVTAEMLGSGTPVDVEGKTLVSVRMTIAPGGGVDAHTHPGTLVATIDSGSLVFTLLHEGEMNVNRAAVGGTPSVVEPLTLNQETVLEAGDWFLETGMVHSAFNTSDEPTVIIISGLIETGQPLTICADPASM
jgi:quercetin dioxygenase-like cupin family protein